MGDQRAGLVGRERPLAAVEQALADVGRSRGRLLLVAGEAGIGKTRLLQESVHRARVRNIDAFVGRCVEGGGAPAFWPWTQVTRGLFAGRDVGTLKQLMGPLAGDLAEVLTELRHYVGDVESPPQVEPEQARFRFFDAVAQVFDRAAREKPLAIAIDDLHDADPASLELLRFVARELSDAPVLLLGTYRDTVPMADKSGARLLGELAREPSATTIQLSGFGLDEVSRFISERTAASPEPEVVDDLHSRTGGNPFFLAQLLPLLSTDADGLAAPVNLPHGIRQAIRNQLDELSADCRGLLALASVMGRDFSAPVLASASGRDGPEVAALLAEATAARLVLSREGAGERHRFAHALVSEVLYDDLGAVERLRLHRRIGEAIEALHRADIHEHLDQLAHHFLAIAPGGDVTAGISYARRAAEQAMRRFAWESGVRCLDRAIEAASFGRVPPEVFCSLLLEAGSAQRRSGDMAAARSTFERARELAASTGLAELEAQAALGLASEGETGLVVPERIAALEQALAAVGEKDSDLNVRLQSRLAHALYFAEEPDTRLALGRRAVEAARRLGSPRTLGYALLDYHFVQVGAHGAEERLEVANEIVSLGRSLNDLELESRGLVQCIEDLLELGRIEDVDVAMAEVDRIAEMLRIPSLSWHQAHHRAMRALHAGRFAEAEVATAQALQMGLRVAADLAWQFYGIQTWILRREQGRLGELADQVRSLSERFPTNTGWRSALAYWDALEGRTKDAERGLAALVDDGLAAIRRDVNWLVAPSLLAEVCFLIEDARRASVLYDALGERPESEVVVGLSMAHNGPVARYLGLCAATMGERDAAVAHLESAMARCERSGARPMLARCSLDLARVHARSGERDLAVARATASLGVAAELGMKRLERDARQLLDEAGNTAELDRPRRRLGGPTSS